MGASERRKGHDYEREIARRLRGLFPDAKRGWQTRGGSEEECDIEGIPFRLEAKHHKSFPSVKAALRQAARKEGDGPCVAVVKQTYGVQVVAMYLDDWLELVTKAYQ